LIGHFEVIDLERGIAWRAARSRRRSRGIDLDTHRTVFTWCCSAWVRRGLMEGKTIGIDGTTPEVNAADRNIVPRESGEGYEELLTRLAKASGIDTPTRADLAGSIERGKRRGRMTIGPRRRSQRQDRER
jgi:hypothetical protein